MTNYKGYTFDYHPKFRKEFNKIYKKHQSPTVSYDFKLLYDVLNQQLEDLGEFEANICNHMSGLANYVILPPFILKKFRCKGINEGANSGFRITFLYDEDEARFICVEMFNKNKKSIPNKERINDLFKKEIHICGELYKGEENFLNINICYFTIKFNVLRFFPIFFNRFFLFECYCNFF